MKTVRYLVCYGSVAGTSGDDTVRMKKHSFCLGGFGHIIRINEEIMDLRDPSVILEKGHVKSNRFNFLKSLILRYLCVKTNYLNERIPLTYH